MIKDLAKEKDKTEKELPKMSQVRTSFGGKKEANHFGSLGAQTS